jgi:chlorophyllase
LNLGVPTLIVGSGLGPLGIPPCAPEKVSHKQFFFDLSEPVFHFVAKDYGHMDFLDDVFCELTRLTCKGTLGSRMPMQRFAGVILLVFVVKNLFVFSSYFCISPPSTTMVSLRLDGVYLTDQ